MLAMGGIMSEEENNDSKMQAFAKLILFLFISLVSFATGTFVGKNLDSSKSTIKTTLVEPETKIASDIANPEEDIDDEASTIITEEDFSEEIKAIDNPKIQKVAKEFEETKRRLLEKAEEAPKTKKAIAPGDFKYTVQVSSYANESEAQTKVKDLKARGFEKAFYIPAIVRGKTWYRVGLDFFDTYKKAANMKSELTKRGAISDAIVQKVEI